MIDEQKAAANRAARMERKRAHLRAVYDRQLARLRELEGQDPLTTARNTNAAMDGLLAADRVNNPFAAGIRCAKGCSHCCNGPVEIGPHESALLIEALRSAGRSLDEQRLERQSGYSVATWRKQPPADRACVFLGEGGACTVYDSRPGACRKLLVLSDPAFCDAGNGAMDQIDRWFSWEAEMMASAALELFGVDLMPRALLAASRRSK